MKPERLERLLRDPGPREAGSQLPPLPDHVLEARAVLRGAGRTHFLRSFAAMGAGVAVAAAAVAITLAFIQQPSSPQVGGTSPTPTPSEPPSATLAPTPIPSEVANLPICTPASLKAVYEAWGGAAGSTGTRITLTNIGTASCSLHGFPGGQIEDANGNVIAEVPCCDSLRA
jgi:hypothetical protein